MMRASALRRTARTCGGALAWLLLAPLAVAQESTLLDELELRIEIGRHERFVATRDAAGAALAPFSTDGCSGGQSAGWTFVANVLPAIAKRHGDRPPWEHCCLAHDRVYHAGGSAGADARASFAARRAADEELRLCVRRTGDDRLDALSADYGLGREEVSLIYRTIADVMHRAVRLGGVPCSGLPWRWGYGWPSCD